MYVWINQPVLKEFLSLFPPWQKCLRLHLGSCEDKSLVFLPQCSRPEKLEKENIHLDKLQPSFIQINTCKPPPYNSWIELQSKEGRHAYVCLTMLSSFQIYGRIYRFQEEINMFFALYFTFYLWLHPAQQLCTIRMYYHFFDNRDCIGVIFPFPFKLLKTYCM